MVHIESSIDPADIYSLPIRFADQLSLTVEQSIDLSPPITKLKTYSPDKIPSTLKGSADMDIIWLNHDVALLDAINKGYVQPISLDRYKDQYGSRKVYVELLPLDITALPKTLVHLTTEDHLDAILKYIASDMDATWGDITDLSYLQTTDMSVYGSFDEWPLLLHDVVEEIRLIRLFYDVSVLHSVRDIFLDPESLVAAPEYLKAYVCEGGLPRAAAVRLDIISVKKKMNNTERVKLSFPETSERNRKAARSKLMSKIENILRASGVPFTDEIIT